jgi:hypothetical protein
MVIKSRNMRRAGKYEMVLSRLVHNLYPAYACTRTLAVLTVVFCPQSLQTDARIVLQLGYHHFLAKGDILGDHSGIAEDLILLGSYAVLLGT